MKKKDSFLMRVLNFLTKVMICFIVDDYQNDLLNATKITGRTKNGLGLALLNAVTKQTEQQPLTNYNVIIFDQSFGNGSSLSLMNTNVVQKGEQKDANVTGVFARINNKKNTHTYNSKLKMSQEFEADNLIKGLAGMFSMQNNNGNYRYRYSLSLKMTNTIQMILAFYIKIMKLRMV